MPNKPMLLLIPALLLSACATRSVDPNLMLEADDALALAVRAGAEDHAPLELNEARQLADQARELADQGEAEAAARLASRAVLQSRLAGVRADGAVARNELEQRLDEYRRLRDELVDAFGPAVLEEGRQ